jgi:hypothetical protein
MADQYYALTGESAYSGSSQGGYLFVDGVVYGYDAGYEHMARLLDTARSRTPDGYHWTHRDGLALLVDQNGTAVRTVAATDHPWRGEE